MAEEKKYLDMRIEDETEKIISKCLDNKKIPSDIDEILGEAISKDFPISGDKRKDFRLLSNGIIECTRQITGGQKSVEVKMVELTKARNKFKLENTDNKEKIEKLIYEIDTLQIAIAVNRMILKKLEEIVKPYLIFDRELFFKNIRYLMDKKEIKTGNFENDAMVAQGYISRVESGRIDSSPTIEFVMYCSKLLEVGIDDLLKKDLTKNIIEEEPVINLLNELKTGTRNKKYKWSIHTVKNKNRDLINRLPKEINGGCHGYMGFYYSLFTDKPIDILNTFMYTDLNNNCQLYIIDAEYIGASSNTIDIYLYKDERIIPFIYSGALSKETSKELLNSYNQIKKDANDVNTYSEGMEIIKDFLNNL